MKNGKVSESIFKRSILKHIKTKRNEVSSGAGLGVDCAIFSLTDTDKMVTAMQQAVVKIETDTDKEAPLRVSMEHLIQRCLNDLAAGGAECFAMNIAMMMPKSTEEYRIKQMILDAQKICGALSIEIAGVDTKVMEIVKEPVVTVTGFGRLIEDYDIRKQQPMPGQDIVLTKWIGLEGTAMLAELNREKLLQRYPAYLVDEAASFRQFMSVIPEAATAIKSGVYAMHNATEGGIFAALWEMAERSGVGLTIDLKKIPLRQETVEVCECCNCNPYELLCGGCMVMTADDGLGLVEALREQNIHATIIGKITDSNDRIIMNDDEVRYMDRPKTDAIYTYGMNVNQ